MFLAIVLILNQTTVSGTIPQDYFNTQDGKNSNKNIGTDNPFQEREEYNENIASQGALCDDPQAIKKYGEVCRGSGEYQEEDAKDKCEVNDDEDGNDNCKIDDDNDNDEDNDKDKDEDDDDEEH